MDYQTALVSGAGSGMGRAIVETLVDAGLRVAMIGRDRAKLEAAREALGAKKDHAIVVPCDVADRAGVEAAVRQVLDQLGSTDIVVCNAGVNIRDRALDVLDPADWDKLIQTNLTGAFNLVHYTLPTMRQRKKGLIVQICSISGYRPSLLGGNAYTASKYGQAGFGLCLGREVREDGIRSTVIYPGEVNTPILDARPVRVPDERKQAILQPEDIAASVRFLAELHPRAHITELVIKPTVDDFA